MANKEVIFTFEYSDWVLATSLEIMASRIDSGVNLGWIDWAEKFQKHRNYPIADKVHFLYSKIQFNCKDLLEKLDDLGNPDQFYYYNSIPKYTNEYKEKESLADEVAYLELISILRESAPIASVHRKILSDFKFTFLQTYGAAKSFLQTEKPDTVFLYNGRFLKERAVWEACKELSVTVVFFEQFNPDWQGRYFLFAEPTHSPHYRSEVMQRFGQKIRDEEPRKFFSTGEEWFLNRRLGRTQHYTKNQNFDSELDLQKPFFVFFHSSEDELLTTNLTSTPWGDQFSAITAVLETLQEIGNYDLVIRMHPNLLHKSNREIVTWNDFGKELAKEYSFVHYVASDSAVSSYKLMEQSVGVITVGSTIGVEAAFFERKSILIGRAFHEYMEITQNPATKDELARVLSIDLTSQELQKAKHNALNYAVFHSQGGVYFKMVRLLIRRGRLLYYFGNFCISRSLVVSLLMRFDIVLKKLRNNFL